VTDIGLDEELEKRSVPVIGSIRYAQEIVRSGLEGCPIHGSNAEREIERIVDRLR
jgi:CO dehydrogenase nickel-insertion accessory protein CooC1